VSLLLLQIDKIKVKNLLIFARSIIQHNFELINENTTVEHGEFTFANLYSVNKI